MIGLTIRSWAGHAGTQGVATAILAAREWLQRDAEVNALKTLTSDEDTRQMPMTRMPETPPSVES